MERIKWASFIVLSTVLALVIQLVIINSVMAQAPNTSLAYDPNTSRIVDWKNHTITIIDKKTDQPVRVCNFTPREAANMTAVSIGNVTTCENLTPVKSTINETLTTNMENATTNINLTSVKPTINETLTTNMENATTNMNLTSKFNDLQGK
ncbi:MAG: hypothetical protein EHM34_06265 [Nitrosopumilales archaeon]|nr:MAG: hypothetical protein EHM34_06265 [Nitrosopumilales archaeon]